MPKGSGKTFIAVIFSVTVIIVVLELLKLNAALLPQALAWRYSDAAQGHQALQGRRNAGPVDSAGAFRTRCQA